MYSLPLTTAAPTSCVGCGYGAKFCQCPSGYCADASVVAATIATADTNHFIDSSRRSSHKPRRHGEHGAKKSPCPSCLRGSLTRFGYRSRRGGLHLTLHLLRERADRHDGAPVRRRELLHIQLEFLQPRV